MTDTTAHPAPDSRTTALGTRLRAVRQERGESVRGLARKLGCSASLLSQIELGKTAPSVGVLYSLANELDVSIDFLLRPEADAPSAGDFTAGQGQRTHPAGTRAKGRPPGSITAMASEGFRSLRQLPPSYQAQIQRADSRRAIDFGNGVRWERLTTTSNAQVDFLEIVYEPGGSSTEDDHSAGHEGFEYGVVTAGALTIRTGNEEYVLGPGDSIAFNSVTPHVFRNAGTTTARAIWFVVHGDRPL
ncbi:helix-turn-helix domain-containing protein [Streptomyces albipurpureus]|uniref:Cupin domain-containing protein n=1 Tax=Streptomyces albipurpureus TaxID=2897419 RepID=A0ABT0URQ3_9ACTN|nr:cupin domain-containing protein [Streptomyces sp. CWNU-1]MCM2390669.1 cupin domain-containing protein [Streptomyces sp. CWNU-1]